MAWWLHQRGWMQRPAWAPPLAALPSLPARSYNGFAFGLVCLRDAQTLEKSVLLQAAAAASGLHAHKGKATATSRRSLSTDTELEHCVLRVSTMPVLLRAIVTDGLLKDHQNSVLQSVDRNSNSAAISIKLPSRTLLPDIS